MRRTVKVFSTLFALICALPPAFAQRPPLIYGIMDSDPTEVHTGNDDTEILITGTTANPVAYTYGICFYNGTPSPAITPQSFDAGGADFIVPAAMFNLTSNYTASVYLSPIGSTCTGTNPGFSNTYPIPITTGNLFHISAESPSPIPAGSGDTTITISGMDQGADELTYGICFYTGTTTPGPILPNGGSGDSATFIAPASGFQIDPSLFVGGVYTAEIYLGPYLQACDGHSLSISNSFPVQIVQAASTLLIFDPPSTTPSTAATQPYVPGGTFSLNFQVTQGPSLPSPTGTVTVSEGGVNLGSTTLAAGAGGASTASLLAFGAATAGIHTLSVAYSGDGVYAPSTQTYTFTVTAVPPTLTWATPAPIVQGTALSATQLDAVATNAAGAQLPGTYVYSPAAGTVLPSGIATLTVVFTPTDATDYTTTSGMVQLTVNIPAATTTLASSLATTQYGQPTTLTATVLQGGTLTAAPTGSVNFLDGTTLLGTSMLSPAGVATLPVSTLMTGPHTLTAAYLGDVADAPSTSPAITQTVTKAPSLVAFAPSPASIVYGTALTVAQLDASATSAYIASVPGAFVYTPALGSVLAAGTSMLSVTFTPADTVNFTAVTQTASLTVAQATPTLSFPTPAPAAVGSTLSAAQLNASATGVTGAALPGTYLYTPAAGAVVTAGPQTLSVTFTPTDTTDYTTATAMTTLNGAALTLVSLDHNSAQLGDPALTVTLTGTGFVLNSVVQAGGTALATTFVNETTLIATVPASTFLRVQTLQISVLNPTPNQTSLALPFVITAPAITGGKTTAPSTAGPADEPTIQFILGAPYPVTVTGTFTLTFAPLPGGIVDPNVKFINGLNTFTFDVVAGQTDSPAAQFQTGTVAGTITIVTTLTAGGVDVTPASFVPVVITLPPFVPGLFSVTLVRDGRNLTVTAVGYSNTREVKTAQFHFEPASGKNIQNQDVTVDAGSLFTGWYALEDSDQYGSEFKYTQTFTLDQDASVVGQVTLTLTNSIGTSAAATTEQ